MNKDPEYYDEKPESDEIDSNKKGHALEKFLDIPPTVMEKEEYNNNPLKKHEDYDDKDAEIEKQFEEIFNKSMTGYLNLEGVLDSVEPKYRSRLAEVALQYLKNSLDAANSKAKQKESLDKIKIKQESISPESKNNNIVFKGDRNDLLKQMTKMMKEGQEPIDAEIVEKDNIKEKE